MDGELVRWLIVVVPWLIFMFGWAIPKTRRASMFGRKAKATRFTFCAIAFASAILLYTVLTGSTYQHRGLWVGLYGLMIVTCLWLVIDSLRANK